MVQANRLSIPTEWNGSISQIWIIRSQELGCKRPRIESAAHSEVGRGDVQCGRRGMWVKPLCGGSKLCSSCVQLQGKGKSGRGVMTKAFRQRQRPRPQGVKQY